KLEGATYPAIQIVFIRSLIGLVSVLPLAWRFRKEVFGTRRAGRHAFRVACNAIALTSNFLSLTLLPLALVSAISFTRPFVVMLFAVILLGENVRAVRWAGTAIGFLGVLVIVAPGSVSWNIGPLAARSAGVFGSLAAVRVRALQGGNTAVLRVFSSVGLSGVPASPAGLHGRSVALADWSALLAIGVLAQVAQYSYLRAYQMAPA